MTKRLLIFIVCLFLISGSVFALEFSADTVMTYKGQDKTVGKIYYKADKFRMDLKSPEPMSVITRIDKKVIWNIMTAQKMYMEMPFELQNRPMVEEKFEGEIERKHVGNETIDGHPTKKYLVTYKSGREKHRIYQWWATDIKFPVKSAAIDNSWVQEYRNIKIAPQPNSLFELPGRYKKFQMPGGMHMKR
ncbi:MAG: DUF4412 domain-containing protein [Nitrospirota bacterium]